MWPSFMEALTNDIGEAGSLEDFERKAQLMNYVTYRAIFEGFQAQLWTRNSGRLLWMTHPAWPSNHWQIYSSDYDTAAAYYGVKKACEPLHAQLDLPDYRLAVVNTTRDAPAAFSAHGTVLVALALTDAEGKLLSSNIYWESAAGGDQKRLVDMPAQPLAFSARSSANTGAGDHETIVTIHIANRGPTPALLARLTLVDESGKPVLPAYYSGNYLTLLPGDSTVVTARCPTQGPGCARVTLRGFNVPPASTPIIADGH
jgi:hypothetical protein